jgi:hypothetical protein
LESEAEAAGDEGHGLSLGTEQTAILAGVDRNGHLADVTAVTGPLYKIAHSWLDPVVNPVQTALGCRP